jgi:NitT/TauT family transport system substrate-binding protein
MSKMRMTTRIGAVLAAVFSWNGLIVPAFADDSLTFVTDFGFNGRHAYYFLALEKGYYKDEGLDVTIVRGQGSSDAVKQVAAGSAQIGFADASAVILARGNDQTGVKLVSIIYAKPPHAIYVLKSSGITKAKDLEGRKLADTAFSSIPKLFPAYAKAAGVDASKVTWLVTTSDALPGLLSLGRADGIGQYTVGEPLLKKAAGAQELNELAYSDAGLDFYGAGLIADGKLLEKNPEMVRRFVKATLKGLSDAVAHPDQAAAALHKAHREVDLDIAQAETEKVGRLAKLENKPMGSVDPARMQKTIDFIASAYQMKSPVSLNEVFAAGFSPQ